MRYHGKYRKYVTYAICYGASNKRISRTILGKGRVPRRLIADMRKLLQPHNLKLIHDYCFS